jgi:threonyl-tRNA synthetase
MKSLLLHSKSIEVYCRQEALEYRDSPQDLNLENVLTVFIAVERGDDDKQIELVIEDILNQAKNLKVDKVLIYPYVHLTQDPEAPIRAISLINELYNRLKTKIETYKAPFGWYKEFKIHVYGHPLSELSRDYKREDISKSLVQESEVKSKFYILDDKLYDIQEFDYRQYPNLEKLVKYETKKSRVYDSDPVHIELMHRLKLVDYEPASDTGNMRYYSKGRLIKKILENLVTEYCINDGAHEVETPIMYDYHHPSLLKYLNRFPARQYTVLSDQKRYFLRFAACFGQFLIAHDSIISYKQLPFKLYELTRYSFRREQSGEVKGLKRLRAFTMPDMHTITKDINQAKEEFLHQLELSKKLMEELDLYDHIQIAFRAEQNFYNENLEFYNQIRKIVGKPILLEIFDKRYAYFITKFEFNFIDSKDKAAALSTVQIDIENAETYDINYIDENGEKKRPIILHASLSGAIERVIFALLEKEGMAIKQGKKAQLPYFLAPIQIRLIPVSKDYIDDVMKIYNVLKNHARVDIDDREETLDKKIRDANMEWIPYIVVYGEKEKKSSTLSITDRQGNRYQISLEEFLSKIDKRYFEKLNMPYLLSKRII